MTLTRILPPATDIECPRCGYELAHTGCDECDESTGHCDYCGSFFELSEIPAANTESYAP